MSSRVSPFMMATWSSVRMAPEMSVPEGVSLTGLDVRTSEAWVGMLEGMPVLSVRTLRRGPELSGAAVPPGVLERLEPFADDPVAFRAAGLDVTEELCARLLAEGVRGLHFYTLNRSTATAELVQRLGLAAPVAVAG